MEGFLFSANTSSSTLPLIEHEIPQAHQGSLQDEPSPFWTRLCRSQHVYWLDWTCFELKKSSTAISNVPCYRHASWSEKIRQVVEEQTYKQKPTHEHEYMNFCCCVGDMINRFNKPPMPLSCTVRDLNCAELKLEAQAPPWSWQGISSQVHIIVCSVQDNS